MPNIKPIIYSFFGVGSGNLGSNAFTDAAFAIDLLADADTVVTNPPMYPAPTPYIQTPQMTATISVLGRQSAISGFGLTLAVLNGHPPQIAIGLAPDQLLAISSQTLEGYGLTTPKGPVTGGSTASSKAFPTPVGNFQLTAIAKATFQATLL